MKFCLLLLYFYSSLAKGDGDSKKIIPKGWSLIALMAVVILLILVIMYFIWRVLCR